MGTPHLHTSGWSTQAERLEFELGRVLALSSSLSSMRYQRKPPPEVVTELDSVLTREVTITDLPF